MQEHITEKRKITLPAAKGISEKPPVKMDGGRVTFEQRLWKGGQALLRSLGPVALYLFLPALLMWAGMFLFGGRSAEAVIGRSGNFYNALGIVLTVFLLHKQSRKRGSSVWEESALECKGLAWKRMALLAVMGMGFAVFFSAVITIIPFPQSLMDSYRSSSEGLKNGADAGLAMISTAVLAPVAEEIVFRGYMLGRLLKGFGKKQAVWMSAVVFALCHVSLLWMAYACFMGLLLAWVSIREDNTAYSIALHIGFNLSVIPISCINRSKAWREAVFGSNVSIALLGGLMFFLAMAAFCRYRREEII